MIIDASLVFSDAQAISVTAASTNYVDALAAGSAYVGSWVVFRVATAFTAAGSATMDIAVETDDNSTFTSPTVLMTLGSAVAKATLIAGYSLKGRLPTGAQRYLRGKYTVASGPMTNGEGDLFITKDADVSINS